MKIVADGIVATRGIGEGRFIPVLFINPTDRPDILELFKTQHIFGQGDAWTQWASTTINKTNLTLVVSVVRPQELTMLVEFEMPRQATLADIVYRSKALYLQLGKEGDRVSDNPDAHKLRIEVLGTFPDWEGYTHGKVAEDIRARGHSKAVSARLAKEVLLEWRKVWDSRLTGEPD